LSVNHKFSPTNRFRVQNIFKETYIYIYIYIYISCILVKHSAFLFKRYWASSPISCEVREGASLAIFLPSYLFYVIIARSCVITLIFPHSWTESLIRQQTRRLFRMRLRPPAASAPNTTRQKPFVIHNAHAAAALTQLQDANIHKMAAQHGGASSSTYLPQMVKWK